MLSSRVIIGLSMFVAVVLVQGNAVAAPPPAWQSQDKRQDAYDLLAPVYGWFSEGFDTADLQDAKALLEGLS